MKHNTDYKFSDRISSVNRFFDAIEEDYSTGVTEIRTLDNKAESYLLTIFSSGDGPNVQYKLNTLDDCLQIATSRIDFMYRLAKKGYLVIAD